MQPLTATRLLRCRHQVVVVAESGLGRRRRDEPSRRRHRSPSAATRCRVLQVTCQPVHFRRTASRRPVTLRRVCRRNRVPPGVGRHSTANERLATKMKGYALSTMATIVAEFGDCRRIRRLSPKTATVAKTGDCRRDCRRIRRRFWRTVGVFGDSRRKIAITLNNHRSVGLMGYVVVPLLINPSPMIRYPI